nr:MAG TPA: hypothetical protein [Caudoviricetes sp.]
MEEVIKFSDFNHFSFLFFQITHCPSYLGYLLSDRGNLFCYT